MKLDTKAMRYLSSEDWRVLAAVEQGSKNHEVVPTPLINQISGLRGGSGVHKCISSLAKVGLIARCPTSDDGYRLTYGGLDYLALNAHRKGNAIYSVGNQIGVGKESDIYVVASSSGIQHVLKIHRLGRISFRTVKANRDYLRNRSSTSWMHMSRLAAMKEYAFMQALHKAGFPVPTPVAQNRHTIVMELIDAFPLRQISTVPDPGSLYDELINMIITLARHGLIHGDFNEFNILIREDPPPGEPAHEQSDQAPQTSQIPQKSTSLTTPPPPTASATLTAIMIDFPQMISIDHANADFYFGRDVQCIARYFRRRYDFVADAEPPSLGEALQGGKAVLPRELRLDLAVEASGFSRKMARELEAYRRKVGAEGDVGAAEGGGEVEKEEDADEEEDEEEEAGEAQDGDPHVPY